MAPRKNKCKSRRYKSGRSRTTDDFVVRRVPCPHHSVYKGQARKATRYDMLSILEFVFWYLGHATKHDVLSNPGCHTLPSPRAYARCQHLSLGECAQLPWHPAGHDAVKWADMGRSTPHSGIALTIRPTILLCTYPTLQAGPYHMSSSMLRSTIRGMSPWWRSCFRSWHLGIPHLRLVSYGS